MNMKRFLITAAVLAIAAGSLWAMGDDEVIVTRQLTSGQRKSLPDKTVIVETKRLVPAKKADMGLIDAITQVMDTIAQEDYQNRTFVMMLEPEAEGGVSIAVRNDYIVTRSQQETAMHYGELDHGRYHFVVLSSESNQTLLERTFKRQGKVKFVQEFEFVQYPTPRYPTHVTCHWSPEHSLTWNNVSINEDPYRPREESEREANVKE